MPASFDNSGKPAYMYDEVGDTWYAFGAKIDTASAYEWTNTQTYLNDVTFDDAVIFKDGFNNFLNPAARDAALTSPVQGTIIFVRQDAGGNTINQIQYYSGSAWTANDGDISQITAGTGLTGGGTAGNITVSVDTTVTATTNNALTLSNKTIDLSSNTLSGTIAQFNTALSDADFATLTGTEILSGKTISATNNTITNVSLTTGVTGTLPVANGGTGITSFGSGVATWLGTPSSANLASAVTDETGSGSLVFGTSPTLTTPTVSSAILIGPEERFNIVASAAASTINIDALTAGVWYYTSNATGNHTLNFRGSASTSMNTILTTGDSITILWLNTNGGTAYYPNGFQVDGASITPKWSGGTAPSAGNTNSIDAYSFTIVKTGNAAFTILAAGAVKYA
jgi:hypothetical protein